MPAKRNNQNEEPQAEAVPDEEAGTRSTGIDALSPADKASAEQQHPFGYSGAGGASRGPSVAGDFNDGETKGSVLPYRADDIDVDSYDARTPVDVEEAQEEEDDK